MKRKSANRRSPSERHLLYVDILGFADLVAKNPEQVERLYRIVDEAELHQRGAFHTLVFSDTIVVYSIQSVGGSQSRYMEVNRLCEFAADLYYRFARADVFFRAVLTRGLFTHYNLQHTECFFGNALIHAYRLEKRIAAVGLFVASECAADLRQPTAPYDNDLSFVYLSWSLERLQTASMGKVPVDVAVLTANDLDWGLTRDVPVLKAIHNCMSHDPDPRVRLKHLATWWYLHMRYPKVLDVLEASNFDLNAVSSQVSWSRAARKRSVPFGDARRRKDRW